MKVLLGFLLTVLALTVNGAPCEASQSPATPPGMLISASEFESWLDSERDIAFARMMDNVGGYGYEAQGVIAGVPVAAPSKEEPDYWYIWTRDAAIVIKTMVAEYADGGATNTILADVANSYIESSDSLQRVPNLSGTFANLSGLGEPKFNVNGTEFTGAWGRPQRDGPGLRASAMIDFFDAQVAAGMNSYSDFLANYSNVVINDLNYIVDYWQQPGFDIWEEVEGFHTYTQSAQMRGLSQGARLAEALGDSTNAQLFRSTADAISQYISSQFYNSTLGHFVETIDCPWYTGRSWYDAATIIAANNVAGMANQTLAAQSDLLPWSARVLSNMYELVSDMRSRYAINVDRIDAFEAAGKNLSVVGTAVGRYPEDVYNGTGTSLGNPWFLTTAAVAEALYRISDYYYCQTASFTLEFSSDSLAAPFYCQFVNCNSQTVQISRNSQEFNCFLQSLLWYADSFMEVLKEHMDQTTGEMSEEYNRDTGYMQGANNLSWSYGAFWTAAMAREVAVSNNITVVGNCGLS
jgi:glucoamylase